MSRLDPLPLCTQRTIGADGSIEPCLCCESKRLWEDKYSISSIAIKLGLPLAVAKRYIDSGSGPARKRTW